MAILAGVFIVLAALLSLVGLVAYLAGTGDDAAPFLAGAVICGMLGFAFCVGATQEWVSSALLKAHRTEVLVLQGDTLYVCDKPVE